MKTWDQQSQNKLYYAVRPSVESIMMKYEHRVKDRPSQSLRSQFSSEQASLTNELTTSLKNSTPNKNNGDVFSQRVLQESLFSPLAESRSSNGLTAQFTFTPYLNSESLTIDVKILKQLVLDLLQSYRVQLETNVKPTRNEIIQDLGIIKKEYNNIQQRSLSTDLRKLVITRQQEQDITKGLNLIEDFLQNFDPQFQLGELRTQFKSRESSSIFVPQEEKIKVKNKLERIKMKLIDELARQNPSISQRTLIEMIGNLDTLINVQETQTLRQVVNSLETSIKQEPQGIPLIEYIARVIKVANKKLSKITEPTDQMTQKRRFYDLALQHKIGSQRKDIMISQLYEQFTNGKYPESHMEQFILSNL